MDKGVYEDGSGAVVIQNSNGVVSKSRAATEAEMLDYAKVEALHELRDAIKELIDVIAGVKD